jgi:threonylcarbamoyladenosine tRNA methylthiotransferase MtaB
VATYWVKSFGCRASAADGEGIALALEVEGAMTTAPDWQSASLVVLNTCAVTQESERDARAMVRRVRRRNPEAKIVVTGCYAQRAPQELAALDGVDAVVGNSHKGVVAQTALDVLGRRTDVVGAAGRLEARGSGARSPGDCEPGLVSAESLTAGPAIVHAPFGTGSIAGEHAEEFALPAAGAGARTRPVLKIQEGCGNRCSFCVIPETRGPSRSVGAEQVLGAVRAHVEGGVQEMVLSGINLGRWGRDLRASDSLPRLVRRILEETARPRLRLSSIEPMDWGDELLALLGEYARGETPRLAPHAHLPLQSGADAILRRMHRRYRPWHYAEKLAKLRTLLPDAAIGADVMVGFPGETDALFQESFDFIAAQPFTYLHLFPYSPRPGTAAEPWHEQAPVARGAVRERMQAVEALGRARHDFFANGLVGKTVSAVSLKNGTALTANFLSVRLQGASLPNRSLKVRIASKEAGLWTGTEVPSEGSRLH